jgi:hypothetical protein
MRPGPTAQGGGTMQFNVPLSHPNGSIIHPPPEDQYTVDPRARSHRRFALLLTHFMTRSTSIFGSFVSEQDNATEP